MSQLTNQPLVIKTKPLFMYKRSTGIQGNQQRKMDTTTTTITITVTTFSPGMEGAGMGKATRKSYSRFM